MAGSSNRGHDFLRAIARFGEANSSSNVDNRPIKLGTIDYDYDPAYFLGGINPRVTFDGEKTVSQKRYPVMSGYYPLAGARVVLVPIGTTYLIIGTVATKPIDPNVQEFTETDTWEKPAGARLVRIQCQGGGGAGGGAPATAASQTSIGAGGSGGSYGESWLFANGVSASVTVTVGAGGVAVSEATGGNGGASSFGSYVSANGGIGGGVAAADGAATAINGAPASSTITADRAIPGQGGGHAIKVGTQGAAGGSGGSSQLGNGARGKGVTTGSVDGDAGYNYGGGGSGGCAGPSEVARIGGDGAPGIVIVTTYF